MKIVAALIIGIMVGALGSAYYASIALPVQCVELAKEKAVMAKELFDKFRKD